MRNNENFHTLIYGYVEKIFGVFYEDWTHAYPTGNLLLHNSNTVLVTLNNIYSLILSVG